LFRYSSFSNELFVCSNDDGFQLSKRKAL